MNAISQIKSDEELARLTERLFALTAKEETTPEEDELIALLTGKIERYETEKYPVPKVKSDNENRNIEA